MQCVLDKMNNDKRTISHIIEKHQTNKDKFKKKPKGTTIQQEFLHSQHYSRFGLDNSLLGVGGCLPCRLFGSIPGLYPLDANSTFPPVVTTKNVF